MKRRRPNPRRRLEAVLIVTLMILSVIGGRLIQLQGLDRSRYATLAEDQRLQEVTLTAPRGEITDSSGQPIAETIDARDVMSDNTEIDGATATATKLAPLLGVDAATLTQELQVHSRGERLATAISPALAAKVLALNLPGIGTIDSSKRIYPDGPLASNIVGFMSPSTGLGRSGLEYDYQQSLSGHNGKRIFEVGVAGNPIPDGRDVLQAPVAGQGLRLTINSDIQWEAQQAIAQQVTATHSKGGSVIVMNPRNGQIVAMATTDDFDPTKPLVGSNVDLNDSAISQVYEPGSVMKGLTLSAAIQDKLITPTTHFVVPNTLEYDGSRFHDAENHPTLFLTTTGILAQSSNIGAIKVAQRLGKQRLYQWFRAFGLGQPTGVGLPGDEAGLVTPVNEWSGTTLPTNAFGQGISVTALQVAEIYATIANDGVHVTPTVIGGTIGSDGKVHPVAPAKGTRVLSAHTAQWMREMLQSVTTSQEGTAPKAKIDGYTVAGKTGTAGIPDGARYKGYTASFVGMVPADHPRLVAEVVLDNPHPVIFGGAVAAPVFHDVMSFALQTLGISPTGFSKPTIPTCWADCPQTNR